jgi:osmotically-inducible protein OsmY
VERHKTRAHCGDGLHSRCRMPRGDYEMTTTREEAIIQLLRSRLSGDRRTAGDTIDVLIENGKVFLEGACDNAQTVEVARMIVEGTCGVGQVVDHLRVRAEQTAAYS